MNYREFADDLMRVRSQLEQLNQSKLTKTHQLAIASLRIHLKAAAFAAGKLKGLNANE